MLTNPDREKLDLGRTLLKDGRTAEAKAVFEDIIRHDPASAEAWHFLGVCHGSVDRHVEAESCFKKAIDCQSRSAHTYYNLGATLLARGTVAEAIGHFGTAVALDPALVIAQIALGDAYHRLRDYENAAASYRKAIQLEPGGVLEFKLGKSLWDRGDLRSAIECFQRAARDIPNDYSINRYLGLAYSESGRFREAITAFEEALRKAPGMPGIDNDLAMVARDMGELDSAEAYYRRALELDEHSPITHSNLLLLLNYTSNDPCALLTEHRNWAKSHLPTVATKTPFTNTPKVGRRLRIGYVSPDFRRHSVAFFLGPILTCHNPERVEIHCYANVRRTDATTAHFKNLAHHWRDIYGIDDEQVAKIIRDDSIDILIDLAGHTGDNRLLLFAHKPAPVQVSYLGYPNTTGLASIDYRLTDPEADPTGQERYHTEKLVRLPDGFLCYGPPDPAPAVGPVPLLRNGFVTLGSFNMLPKTGTGTIQTWGKLLMALPNSRLLLKNRSLQDAEAREILLRKFEQVGVSRDRIEFIHWVVSTIDHLELYNRVDIALDTFPYNGTTTTCEALWMGVPVVTLAGNRHAGRVGVSILTCLELSDLIAGTPDDYVRITCNLADDRDRLTALRSNLRHRMSTSPLCDANAFTRKLEAAYQEMWRHWCMQNCE